MRNRRSTPPPGSCHLRRPAVEYHCGSPRYWPLPPRPALSLSNGASSFCKAPFDRLRATALFRGQLPFYPYLDKTNHIGYKTPHLLTVGARVSAVGGRSGGERLQVPAPSGAAGVGVLPWPGRLRLRHTWGGGAKGESPTCPILSVQPGSVEDQDYSTVQLEAATRGGPAQTRRCTDGMDRGCPAMHGMDAAMPLSESPRGWAGHGDRRWRLTRHDREEHRRARDRNRTS